MKQLLLLLICILTINAQAQVTITAADMPVHGDTLRYSNALAITSGISLADSGAGIDWNYMTLMPISQAVDTYKKAYEVNPVYAASISLSAIGYKVADSVPGVSLISAAITIDNVYTFFERMSGPSCYAAAAYAATISGFIPIPFNYTQPDAWYFFPLTYGRYDSSDFELNMGLMSVANIQQKGYRKTRVDGWGRIMTPYYNTPPGRQCLRVRSEIHEIDSVQLDTIAFALPRTTVEYKWLIPGEHYPALWVTTAILGGAEVPTIVRYRDVYRQSGPAAVTPVTTKSEEVTIYPNPSTGQSVTLTLPANWQNFYVEVFDVQGKLITQQKDARQIDVSTYTNGQYMVRVTYGTKTTYLRFVK